MTNNADFFGGLLSLGQQLGVMKDTFYIRSCRACQDALPPFEAPYTSETNARTALSILRELDADENTKVFGVYTPASTLMVVKGTVE